MKTLCRFLVLCVILGMSVTASAQLINCNPNPNGEPWWAGWRTGSDSGVRSSNTGYSTSYSHPGISTKVAT